MPITRYLSRASATTAGIQRACDELQDASLNANTTGLLRLPIDGVLTLDEPIVLPRGDVNGYGLVSIEGQGPRATHLRGSNDAFPAGRAVIERAPRSGGSAVTGLWRSLRQTISNLTIRVPRKAGCRAIHLDTEDDADPTTERWTGAIRQLYIECHNDYHEEAIRIVGNVHLSAFEDIWCDPTLGDGTYDTTLLRVDDGEDAASDTGGLFGCTLDRLYATPVAGGLCALFRGRLASGSVGRAWESGYGTKSTPSVWLKNCAGVALIGMQFEGHAAKPQLRMDSCRFTIADAITLGVPSRPTAPPYPVVAEIGNGIELYDCSGCRIHGAPRWTGNPSWTHLNYPTTPAESKYAVTLDADCIGNYVEIGIGNIDTLATATRDLGRHNRIRTINPYAFAANRVEETYDGEVVIP